MRVDHRTVDAGSAGLLKQLLEQSVVVPWDSRTATDATIGDISETKVREHLRDCGSALADEPDARHVYRKMDLAGRINDHELPRNVAQNKLWLAGQAHREGETARNRTLLADARILLERLLRMDAPSRRHAWAWRELARARRWLGEPATAVDEAYANATRLAPDETKFRREWGRFAEGGSLPSG